MGAVIDEDGSKPDANDWNYDAYLANDRTLERSGGRQSGEVRARALRIINGSSGTNYFVDLASCRANNRHDGMPVEPIRGSRFPLAIAQRIDVRVQIPAEGGAFPILALRELSREQTGVILATQERPAHTREGRGFDGAVDARSGEDVRRGTSAVAAFG